MKNIVVIGMGLFGSEIAVQLSRKGANVLAIDINPEKINAIADRVNRAVSADATKRDVLLQLGVNHCDCAVVASTRDLAASVLITMNLKAIGVKEIICKTQNDTDKEILKTLGATRVIVPEVMAAEKLCKNMISRHMLEYVEVSPDYSIVEVYPPESWLHHTIREVHVRARYGLNIIGIRTGGKMALSPDADYVFQPGDVLILLGEEKNIEKLHRLY